MNFESLKDIKIEETLRTIDINKVLNIEIKVLDYKITKRKNVLYLQMVIECPKFCTKWQKLRHKIYHLFHIKHQETEVKAIRGYYSKLINFLLECEKAFAKEELLPLENTVIEERFGYYFRGSCADPKCK